MEILKYNKIQDLSIAQINTELDKVKQAIYDFDQKPKALKLATNFQKVGLIRYLVNLEIAHDIKEHEFKVNMEQNKQTYEPQGELPEFDDDEPALQTTDKMVQRPLSHMRQSYEPYTPSLESVFDDLQLKELHANYKTLVKNLDELYQESIMDKSISYDSARLSELKKSHSDISQILDNILNQEAYKKLSEKYSGLHNEIERLTKTMEQTKVKDLLNDSINIINQSESGERSDISKQAEKELNFINQKMQDGIKKLQYHDEQLEQQLNSFADDILKQDETNAKDLSQPAAQTNFITSNFREYINKVILINMEVQNLSRNSEQDPDYKIDKKQEEKINNMITKANESYEKSIIKITKNFPSSQMSMSDIVRKQHQRIETAKSNFNKLLGKESDYKATKPRS